ncbi:antA/AntB antirepressor family protein [Chromobacterium violaceum]|uniref:antA/AntB antirepressor family protein n=1 Tax=Chromobacterium violaceum TaxID=536 RepID=UPI001B33198A|nr:antA/AntB antirepressor family protein [Chromobacterium violaceum]MBP4049044.1 antA/AntB antirepressor family protein [Chromobacterium violaceum]
MPAPFNPFHSSSEPLVSVFTGQINQEPALLCDARDLHEFLQVGRRFATWIAERIVEYGFLENQDFAIASQNGEAKRRGGHNRIDYHLTLDTAKELAMVERTEQGRRVRRYFIECEKRLQQQMTYRIPAGDVGVDAVALDEMLGHFHTIRDRVTDMSRAFRVLERHGVVTEGGYPGWLELRDAAAAMGKAINRLAPAGAHEFANSTTVMPVDPTCSIACMLMAQYSAPPARRPSLATLPAPRAVTPISMIDAVRDRVREWADRQRPGCWVTVDQLAQEALGLKPDEITGGDRTRLGRAIRELKWYRRRAPVSTGTFWAYQKPQY